MSDFQSESKVDFEAFLFTSVGQTLFPRLARASIGGSHLTK